MAHSPGAAASIKSSCAVAEWDVPYLSSRHPLGPITPVHFHSNPPWQKPWSHSSLPAPFCCQQRESWINTLIPTEPWWGQEGLGTRVCWDQQQLMSMPDQCDSIHALGTLPKPCVCSLKASPGHHVLSLGEDRTLPAENHSLVILHLFYHLFSSLSIYCKVREAAVLSQGRGRSREAAAWAARPAMPSWEQSQSSDCRGANNPSVPRAWLNTASWFIGLQIKVRPAHFLPSMNF